MAKKIGKKDEVLGSTVNDLGAFPNIYGRPDAMPNVGGNECVICGYDQGLGETLYLCETLSDMQELYDAYAGGYALRICWYRGKITPAKEITINGDYEIAKEIIEKSAPDTLLEVKQAILSYPAGNPGAAKVIAEQAKDLTTEKEVEALVGWPLCEHSVERAVDIWDRFRT